MNRLERMLATVGVSAIGLVGQLHADTREVVTKIGATGHPYLAGEVVKDNQGNIKEIIPYSYNEAYNNKSLLLSVHQLLSSSFIKVISLR